MTKEKGAMHKQTIRVVYPTGDAKMVLRTEQNWDANIEPVGQNDCVSKFAIETERPTGSPPRQYRAMVARRKFPGGRDLRRAARHPSILYRRHPLQRLRGDASARQRRRA